ncbi:MAG: hypothetical protein JW882_05385 [Deltaproteobacteria bacterium]|nr:hypothetical protein [Deltaproteobacteria bacterium]
MKKLILIPFLTLLALVASDSIFADTVSAEGSFGVRIRIGDRPHGGHPHFIQPRERFHRPMPRYHTGYYKHSPHFSWRGTVILRPSYPRYYYSSPPMVIQRETPVYIQKGDGASDYWYYCRDPEGFYPYVKDCNCEWLKVVPETTPPK